MYKLEAGNSYKDLKEMGVSDKKAQKVAKSVGAINAAIESGENIIDLLSFEGAGKIAANEVKNRAAKEMRNEFSDIVETLGEKQAKNYLERLYGSEIAENVLKTYGKNALSETVEEASQETVGILGERYATGSEGIKRDGSKDLQRIGQAGLAGGGSALLLGAPTSMIGNATSYGINKANNIFANRGDVNGIISNNNDTAISTANQVREIINQKESGQIDTATANQLLADVQNGTYQQNQNNEVVMQEAQQQFNAINQQEQTGQIDSQTAQTERQAIINTIEEMNKSQSSPDVVQSNVESNTTETQKEKKNKVEVGKQYTYSNNGSTARYEVKEIRNDGNVVIKIKSSNAPSLVGKTLVLKADNKSLQNAQEYKSNIKYEDLLKDTSSTKYDKKMYAKAKNTDMDMSEYEKTLDFITPNRAGNYSKQQILTLAEELGKKSKAKTGEELKQEAINYWVNKEPYKKTDSKTKYLKMEEFLKSYYKGAGVGEKIENQTVQEVKSKENASKEKQNANVQEKVEQQKITSKVLNDMSKDLTEDLNKAFKLKKGEAYSRTPQTAVKNTAMYENAPMITDFDRETVIHTIMTDEAAKISAETKYNENGTLEENAAYIRGLLQSDKRLTKNDKALAIYTMTKALEQGNKEIADGIISDLTVLDVEAGQWSQASKLMKQMTPAGQLQTFIKMINNSVEKGNPRFKNVEITDDMVNKVLQSYDEDGKWDNDLFAKNMEEFKANIQEQMTPTAMDKFNSIRMLGMLGAPRTHIRNILGNTGNFGLRVVKNFNDRLMENVLIRDKDQRTRTFKPTTKEIKEYVNNLTKDEIMSGNKYDDTKTELERNMKVFNEKHKGMAKIINPLSKTINTLSGGNSFALDIEDKFFSSVAYKTSLQEFLTARGMKTVEDINNNPKILAEGKKFALQQAQEATYRQDSELASAINNYVKRTEKTTASKGSKLGGIIVEANIPFKKTPINIAKTGIQYSPIGLVNGVYDIFRNVGNGKMEMSQAIDEISKGVTGLGLLGVGALLAHNGFEITAADDDKDKKAKYDKSLGEMEYSIKVGDRYYDLSWMAPASMPFYTGVELYQTLVKTHKFDGNAVINTLAKTIDPLASMSLLQGLSSSLKSFSKTPGEFISKFTLSSLENYVTQYIPTLFSQIANISDDRKRTTTPSGKSSFTEFDKTWNNIKYKIPGLRQTLPEQTDVWGRTQKNEDFALRAFNSLINPANNSKDKKDATDRELERLYNDLGDDNYYSTRALPKVDFDKYLTYNKEKYNLSNKELNEYKKTYGKTAKKGADKLIKTKEYKNASDEEKAKMLSSLYDYANQKAKEQYGKKHGLSYDDYKLDQLYSLVDAYNIPIEKAVSNKSIQQLTAEDGITAKQRKLNAVAGIDGLNDVQKTALKRKFTMFMGRPGYTNGEYALVDALNDSNVSEETKKDIRRFLSLD